MISSPGSVWESNMTKLIIVLGVLGASFSAIFVRLSSAPSLVLVFYRMLFATAVLLPVCLVKNRAELKEMTKKEFCLSALSGVFLGLHFACYFSSLRYTSIAASVVLVDTEVFFVAVISLALWKKEISKFGWIGIGSAFLGSVLIAVSDAGGGSNVLLGDGLALMGAVFVAVYTLIGTVVRRTRSTTVYTTVVYGTGALTVLLVLLFTGTAPVGYEPQDYAAALGLAVFCTLMGHSIFSWGLHYESPAFVSMAKLLEPVFATIMGIFLFQEIPGGMVVLGGLIVIFGVAFYCLKADSAVEKETAK